MTIGSPFDGSPDHELGAALRALLSPGEDAAFAARVLARLEPGSPWEALAQWARPGLAAALLLAAALGFWFTLASMPPAELAGPRSTLADAAFGSAGTIDREAMVVAAMGPGR
jgi:hypothetical protein